MGQGGFHNFKGTTKNSWKVGREGPQLKRTATDRVQLRDVDDASFASLELQGIATGVRSVSTSDSLTIDDQAVLASAPGGPVTLTLPAASTLTGSIITVKRTDSSANLITVDTTGGDTIDGVSSVTMADQHDVYVFQSDGTSDWRTLMEPNPLSSLTQYKGIIGDATNSPVEVPYLSLSPTNSRTLSVSSLAGLADYDDIASAITAAIALSPTSTDPVAILVYPGVYTEPALTVPSWITIQSLAGQRATEIQASSPTQTGITLSSNSRLDGFTISGCSGAGGIGVLMNTGTGGPAILGVVAVSDCETGFRIDNTGTLCVANTLLAFRNSGETLDTAIQVAGGGRLDVGLFFATGLPPATNIGLGVDVQESGSRFTAGTFAIEYADEGLFVDDDGEFVLQGGQLRDITTNGVRLGTTGTPIANIGSLTISSGATRDIKCDGTNGILRGSGASFDHQNSDFCDDTNLLGTTQFSGENASISVGNFGVGLHDFPSDSFLGAGPHYVEGMEVLTDDGTGTNFTDETADAASISGSTFTVFQGTGTGNVMYVGGDSQFYGIWHNTQTALSLGTGSIEWEYWDGSAWSSFLVMSTDADPTIGGINRNQYANTVFERGTTLENIRFGGIDPTSWAQNSVNGSTKYWIRVRVTSAITTSPTLEQVRLHANSALVNGDGSLEFFGTARQEVLIPGTKFPLFNIGGFVFTSPSEDINVSSNITLEAIGNELRDGNVDTFSSSVHVPLGICTSCPLTFKVKFAPIGTGSGDVELTLITLQKQIVEVGDVLDGTLTEITQNEVTTVSTGSDDEIQQIVEFEIDLDQAIADDIIAFSIQRDATAGNANDTFANSIYLVDVQVFGVCWRVV